MSKGNFLLGMALGTMVGGALGVLSMTRKGRRWRRDMKRKLEDLQDDVCEFIEKAKDKAADVKDDVIDKINKDVEALKEKVDVSEDCD